MNTYPTQLKTICAPGRVTIATAESVTAGGIASAIASVAGSSAYLEGGVVAYTLRQKVNLLNINEAHAASCDCVSAQVAREMAAGVKNLLGTDVGIAITGYAGLVGADGVTKPYAWVGFAVGGLVWAERVVALSSNRVEAQREYVTVVLRQAVGFLHGLAIYIRTFPDESQLSWFDGFDEVGTRQDAVLKDVARRLQPLL